MFYQDPFCLFTLDCPMATPSQDLKPLVMLVCSVRGVKLLTAAL